MKTYNFSDKLPSNLLSDRLLHSWVFNVCKCTHLYSKALFTMRITSTVSQKWTFLYVSVFSYWDKPIEITRTNACCARGRESSEMESDLRKAQRENTVSLELSANPCFFLVMWFPQESIAPPAYRQNRLFTLDPPFLSLAPSFSFFLKKTHKYTHTHNHFSYLSHVN